jgi:serine/threonine protein kinase
VKVIDSSKILEKFAENEIESLKILDHENIIKFEEYFKEKQYYYIVTEYVEGLTLEELLSERRNNELCFEEKIRIFYELL